MNPLSFEEAVARICETDTRYDPDAYRFVREALDYSIRFFEKPKSGMGRHVSGHELLDGIRQFALAEYGPMAYRVLTYWGLHQTSDFGEIVFNLVDMGVLGRTEDDHREDFTGGYSFEQAFRTPFLPANTTGTRTDAPAREAPEQPQP